MGGGEGVESKCNVWSQISKLRFSRAMLCLTWSVVGGNTVLCCWMLHSKSCLASSGCRSLGEAGFALPPFSSMEGAPLPSWDKISSEMKTKQRCSLKLYINTTCMMQHPVLPWTSQKMEQEGSENALLGFAACLV